MTTVLNVELKLTKEEKEKIINECLDILNERLIEELEEIKAEIEADSENRTSEEQIGMEYATEIIDNHINKADCDNDCEHCEWVECPKE